MLYKLKWVFIVSWIVECPITRGQGTPGREVKHPLCTSAKLYQLTVLQWQDVKNKKPASDLFAHSPCCYSGQTMTYMF